MFSRYYIPLGMYRSVENAVTAESSHSVGMQPRDLGLERGRPARLCALGNQTSLEGTPRRVGEHLPNRFGVQFKLVWFYYAQRRAGRPRSSPSPLRGIGVLADSGSGKRAGISIAQNQKTLTL
ncbi:MAG: hypothetical protein LBQ66_00290 [Planctomycetaceae bacterium]|jgi:hypothetical protein|nr:hypothetical protein [Planctomycetaceae bacterium]